MKARERIEDYLRNNVRPKAIHEIVLVGISQVSVSSRLREMTRDGVAACRRRDGTAYKEWWLTEAAR